MTEKELSQAARRILRRALARHAKFGPTPEGREAARRLFREWKRAGWGFWAIRDAARRESRRAAGKFLKATREAAERAAKARRKAMLGAAAVFVPSAAAGAATEKYRLTPFWKAQVRRALKKLGRKPTGEELRRLIREARRLQKQAAREVKEAAGPLRRAFRTMHAERLAEEAARSAESLERSARRWKKVIPLAAPAGFGGGYLVASQTSNDRGVLK